MGGFSLSAVHSFWDFLITTDETQWVVFTFGVIPFLQHQILFWTYNFIINVLTTNGPKDGKKIQKLIVTPQEFNKCIKLVLFNQFFVMLPITLLFAPFVKQQYPLQRTSLEFLPTWRTLFLHLAICIIVEEILFYYSHRLLHYGIFYTQIHKIHHQFKAPIGIASEYAHPIEMVISNMLPIIIGPHVCQCHILVSWLWFAIGVIGTIGHHSGYLFPWLIGGLDPKFHDYHHYSFISNFGLLGLFDYIHGTNRGYKEYLAKLA